VAAQVASLQQKHDAEILESERTLRAAVSRIEPRVRSLEGQGMRTDRRAAELAGLAQALTEEQRSLLLRLDRLEEQCRTGGGYDRGQLSSRGLMSDELLRRLGNLEREQQAVALNMRLIVDVAEESQQRQTQRLQQLDESLESRLRAVEEEFRLRLNAGSLRGLHGPPDSEAARLRDHCSALSAELNAAERRAGDLLQRCEGGVACASDDVGTRARLQVTERELLGRRARLDATPEHEQPHASLDSIAEVRRHLSQVAAVRPSETRTSDEVVVRMVEAHDDAIQELRGRIETPPVDLRRVEALAEAVEELRGRCNEPPGGSMADVHVRLDRVARDHSDGVAAIAKRVDEHAQAFERLHARVDAEISSELRELRLRAEATVARAPASPAAAMDERFMKQAMELTDLRSRMDDLPALLASNPAHQLREAASYIDESQERSPDKSPDRFRLADEIFDLRQRCTLLQETVEQNIQVSLWHLERQQREALEKVEGVITESSERCAKLEEHDVRLNISLAKLDANEQKCQGCLDRLEHFPSVDQLRMMWREEIRKQSDDANLHGLAAKLSSQQVAMEELGDRVQDMHDRIVSNLTARQGGGSGARIFESQPSTSTFHSPLFGRARDGEPSSESRGVAHGLPLAPGGHFMKKSELRPPSSPVSSQALA